MILRFAVRLCLRLAWLALILARTILAACVRLLELTLATVLGDRSVTYGSSRWSSYWEILRSGALGRCGLIIGKIGGRFIRYKAEGFVLLFAPTRTGKGYSVVIPNLLEYPGSIIVIDIKGENHAITSRARALRGPVWTLNVMDPAKSHGFNPLDMIQVGTWHEADDAKQLADLLIIPTSDGEHWDEKARALLGTILLYVCHKYADQPELRTLAHVRALAAQDWPGLEALLLDAVTLPSISLREEATSLLAMEKSDELKSIKSTVDKATGIWSIDKPAGIVSSTSDFRFEDLNRGVATVYVMVPEEKLTIYRGFLRAIIGCALTAMTRQKQQVPKKKTLLLLDEAAALGRLQPIEDGVGFLATYMRMIMVWQDLDQLQRTYSRARSIIANAGCKVAFNVSDIETARMLADSIGYTTTLSRSAGRSHSDADSRRGNTSEGVSEAARYLVDPAEIMRLADRHAIILMPRLLPYPILARKVRYWLESRWRDLWDSWRVEVPYADPLPAEVTD
ncbi:type IV secretory system conjugative DNA transfer family protein [Bradyrhizobium sp. CIAT3101]|uniref:type IV secretory system conjugative DNA transfer family protein n=1 Tax=Bradyrhizobium sp. CIAT3101 TaxID=439387 RepID=UPI0024B1ED97|nr:type IV secretory system conjugative DNA transfer family protein [Bradyrhizobium sp. CIAT3101]WFU79405.1 type IV secretory system conjugative DNA transfer family protein [Bradyrhizobium sp. CIAT3101]